MRYALIVAVVAVLAGCAAREKTASPQVLPEGAVGTLSMQQAVGTMGKPNYEKVCEDGSTTLGWKHQASGPQAITPTPQGRFLLLQSPPEGAPNEVLVCKFDQNGKLLWWRETK